MSETDDRWDTWILGLIEGDSHVAYQFWENYGERLNRLAEKHLAVQLQRRVGPDDVVQSACRTFFRRAMAGEFKLPDSESLWSLLCAITLTKIRQHVRFHRRQRRDVDQEQYYDAADDGSKPPQKIASFEPTPEEAAQFADVLQALLAGLDEDEQRLIELKLAQSTNQEAADRLGCSERTVRRIVKRIQSRLRQVLDEATS